MRRPPDSVYTSGIRRQQQPHEAVPTLCKVAYRDETVPYGSPVPTCRSTPTPNHPSPPLPPSVPAAQRLSSCPAPPSRGQPARTVALAHGLEHPLHRALVGGLQHRQRAAARHPGVCGDLLQADALRRVLLQQPPQQVLRGVARMFGKAAQDSLRLQTESLPHERPSGRPRSSSLSPGGGDEMRGRRPARQVPAVPNTAHPQPAAN